MARSGVAATLPTSPVVHIAVLAHIKPRTALQSCASHVPVLCATSAGESCCGLRHYHAWVVSKSLPDICLPHMLSICTSCWALRPQPATVQVPLTGGKFAVRCSPGKFCCAPWLALLGPAFLPRSREESMTLTAHSRADSNPSSTDRKLPGGICTSAVPYMVITSACRG